MTAVLDEWRAAARLSNDSERGHAPATWAVTHGRALAERTTVRAYRFDGIEVPGAGRGWAAFYLDDTHGTLALVSDWGTWSHRWGRGSWLCESQNLSDALRERFGADYVARKLFVGVPDEFDGRATVKGWRERVLQGRRERRLTRSQARDAWEAFDYLDANEATAGLLAEAISDDGDLRRAIGDSYWESAVYRKPHAFGVVRDGLLPLLIEALEAEASS